jgi:hypothetical protein
VSSKLPDCQVNGAIQAILKSVVAKMPVQGGAIYLRDAKFAQIHKY